MSKAKIVTLDIETAPNKSYHWGLWKENIGLEQIQDEWSILSVSYKWLHEKKVHFIGTGGRGVAKVHDDKPLLEQLWKVLDEADIVVTQNGKAFDIPKIRARMIIHGFKPYSPIKQVDTKLEAQKTAVFTSNRLAWLSKYLSTQPKSEHKAFPGFELWAECLKDNPAAWREMEKYNKVDVLATEEVYLRLRDWMENHPNVAVYGEGTNPACPKCGSEHVQKRGFAYTQTGQYIRYHCQDCMSWSRSRFSLNGDRREALLTST